jgi:hypothetical protein
VQILPNASAIAEGSPDGNLVHQLRVGIRRLRTALKHFKFAPDYIDPNWLMVLKQTFSLLGEYRDKEILQIKTKIIGLTLLDFGFILFSCSLAWSNFGMSVSYFFLCVIFYRPFYVTFYVLCVSFYF